MLCVHDWYDDGNRLTEMVSQVASPDPAYDNFDLAGAGEPAQVEVISVDLDEAAIAVVIGDQALFDMLAYNSANANESSATLMTTEESLGTVTTEAAGSNSTNNTAAVGSNTGESDFSSSRLETNSSGKQDFVLYSLASRPYDEVKIELISTSPAEGAMSPPFVAFASDDSAWMVPQVITVSGQNSSGKTVVYDIEQTVQSNDTTYVGQGKLLGTLTVVNEYPLPQSGDTVVVQNGYSDFGDFLESDDGVIVWYIVGAVATVVVALVVGLVAMNSSYRKRIQEERQQAIKERAALIAGSEDVDIAWNDSELNRVTGASKGAKKVKGSKIIAVSGGSVIDGDHPPRIDPTENIQRRMGIMVTQMQGHLLKLHGENVTLAQKHMVEPCAVEESMFSSTDSTLLLSAIKKLKLHNFEIQEGQVSRSATTRRKARRSKKRSAAL